MPREVERICSVEGCEKPKLSRGMCPMHLERWRKYGDPHHADRSHAPPEVRFWRRVHKTEDCWPWIGAKALNGYGRFQIGGKGSPHVGAHRYSYGLAKGPIPEGVVVMHSCDNPSCVNPDHLSTGTYKDNTQDMIAKGRKAPFKHMGDNHGSAVLNAEKVRYIRASPLRNLDLARELGVYPSAISNVRRGKTWRHVV